MNRCPDAVDATMSRSPEDVDPVEARFVHAKLLLDHAHDESLPLAGRLVAMGKMAGCLDDLFTDAPGLPAATNSRVAPQPKLTADSLTRAVAPLLDEAAALLNDELLPELARAGVCLASMDQLTPRQLTALDDYFQLHVFPLLLPLAVDPGHPFPRLNSGQLNLLVHLRAQAHNTLMGGVMLAVLQIPHGLPRWIQVPGGSGGGAHGKAAKAQPTTYVWLEDLVRTHTDLLFPGLTIRGTYIFRVVGSIPTSRPHGETDFSHHARGSDVQHHQVQHGSILHGSGLHGNVRLDIEAAATHGLTDWLANHIHLPLSTVARNVPPMAMADLVRLAALIPAPTPWYRRWSQRLLTALFGHINP